MINHPEPFSGLYTGASDYNFKSTEQVIANQAKETADPVVGLEEKADSKLANSDKNQVKETADPVIGLEKKSDFKSADRETISRVYDLAQKLTRSSSLAQISREKCDASIEEMYKRLTKIATIETVNDVAENISSANGAGYISREACRALTEEMYQRLAAEIV